jgi:hypothetical protein
MRVHDSRLRINGFPEAEEALGGKDAKTLCNNTTLVRLDPDTIGVCLHSTHIVKYHRSNRITLDSGCWRSKTTKQRMNAVLPTTLRVVQRDYSWYVATPDGDVEFQDRMTL